ncbi:mycothione reductase [Corynebacterium crudilactis]|uniref:Mycothione reductase n=1 Tax=Corynebacterium crudilactis TaxID=1652495 RepID=A0A172QUD3_9CORY|nr:mycothione reductase [Corynebacterium crudilactis]ANE04276.1 mycothione reductase [Corynebacterium crudilactis]
MSEQSASAKHYDLIIIGTGSGNSIPGPEFDDKSIAIVEKGAFGGTCLNVGCIPTKMYVYAADIAKEIQDSARLGLDTTLNGVDWPSIVSRVFDKRIDPIAQGGEAYRRGPKTPNIDVYDMHASFVDAKTISTGIAGQEQLISGTDIVIATGSRPYIPEAIAESGARFYTNEDIMRLSEQPQSIVIVGGGFIALEFAHVFEALGTKVTILNRSDVLLREADADISAQILKLSQERFDVRLRTSVTAVRNKTDDNGGVTVSINTGEDIDADILLVATGRTPNGDQMNLDAAGIDMDGRQIKVDDFGRTCVDGVWALGDVSSPFKLKHVANAEMRAIKHNLAHPDDLQKMPHDFVPSAVFTNPQIAQVGMTEKEAREAGLDITVKIQNYSDVAYGWAMEDTSGFVKLIADKGTGKLVGAHIIGAQASTLIQQLITVMAFGIDAREAATKQYWIHPALPEVIENALLGLEF